jgi:hypothetical protein
MKPPFAYLSPTGTAFAAAIGISLAVFLLAGVGVQVEPTPLLPAIGAAAQRVAADLPATPIRRARAPQEVGKGASSAQLGATRPQHSAPQRRQAASTARRAHRRDRTGLVPGAPPAAPVEAAAPSVPGTPVTRTTAKGKAPRPGHGHGRASKSTRGAPERGAHGHAKKASTAPSPVSGTPPKANGGGNGHKGEKK